MMRQVFYSLFWTGSLGKINCFAQISMMVLHFFVKKNSKIDPIFT